jgi:hypothetical protein
MLKSSSAISGAISRALGASGRCFLRRLTAVRFESFSYHHPKTLSKTPLSANKYRAKHTHPISRNPAFLSLVCFCVPVLNDAQNTCRKHTSRFRRQDAPAHVRTPATPQDAPRLILRPAPGRLVRRVVGVEFGHRQPREWGRRMGRESQPATPWGHRGSGTPACLHGDGYPCQIIQG